MAANLQSLRTYSHQEMETALRDWGSNSGPVALGLLLQIPLVEVRELLPEEFALHGYLTPDAMGKAVRAAGRPFTEQRTSGVSPKSPWPSDAFQDVPALCRVQFIGPWQLTLRTCRTVPEYTHWLISWREGLENWVCCPTHGVSTLAEWLDQSRPRLIKPLPKADGRFFITHLWRFTEDDT